MLKSKVSQWLVATVFSLPTVMLLATPEARAADYYGAIAYSESTGSHGYSYDFSNRASAESRALDECANYSGSDDCTVLVWFRNACGALATAPSGAYGSGWGSDRRTAEGYALDTCSQYGRNCAVVRWVCTSR